MGLTIEKRLHATDLQAAADRLQVPLASLKALMVVESRGTGFLKDGRPVILLERHIAFKRAKKAGLDALALQRDYPNIIRTAPGGYVGGAAEWGRFTQLLDATNPSIAVESCSWGLFQIMGFHSEALGYPSAQGFQQAMTESEAGQLDALVRFIGADAAMLGALRNQKWANFARRYNGPGYKANAYDTKLASAYTKAMGERA